MANNVATPMRIHAYHFHALFFAALAETANPFADWSKSMAQIRARLDDAAMMYIAGDEL